MEKGITDWNTWSAHDYYRFYFSQEVLPDEKEALRYQIKFLQRANQKFGKGLDYGCGPTLHRAIAAATYVRSMDMADRIDNNLAYVQRWLHRHPEAHNWRPFTTYILECEGAENPSQENLDRRDDLTRSVISDLLQTDATREHPLGMEHQSSYDLIIIGWCLECITTDKAVWRVAMKNVLSMLNAGGSLVMAALHRCHAYQVGENWFPSCYLEASELHDALVENDFKESTIDIRTAPMPLYKQHGWESILLASGMKSD